MARTDASRRQHRNLPGFVLRVMATNGNLQSRDSGSADLRASDPAAIDKLGRAARERWMPVFGQTVKGIRVMGEISRDAAAGVRETGPNKEREP